MDVTDHQPKRPRFDHAAGGLTLTRGSEGAGTDHPLRVLVPVLVIVVVAALDLTVIAPILPSMLFDLRVNTAEADRYVWVVSGYLLAYTLTIPLMGRLSDVVGRRTTFLIALAIFLGGSAVCAVAESLPAIIVGRAVQGIGGGAMVPVAMAVVGDLLPPGRRAAALGIVAATDTLGWVLGPIWGAGIQQLLGGWRWIFVLNLPIGLAAAAALVVSWRGRVAAQRSAVRPDVAGALLLSAALVSINLGVSVAAEPVGGGGGLALGAAPNPLASYRVPLLVAGIIALLALVFVEARAPNPLIPLGIFRQRAFSAANATNFLVGAALIVAMVNVPLLTALLVDEKRVSIVSAELLSAFSLAMALAALAGGRLADVVGYRRIATLGLVIAALGFWRMSGWGNALAIGRMAPDLAIAGAGLGIVIAPIGAAAINAARREDLGIASGLVIVMRLLGMTLGISALTAWAVGRLNEALTHLPTVPQKAGETLSQYLARQQAAAVETAIPATLAIIRDTFAVAAVICLAAAVPAMLLAHRRQSSD